jgi:hypothetical protein
VAATGVVEVGADLLARAQTASRPVRLAAETRSLTDCGYCTFAPRTRAALTTQLSTVDAAAARYATFAGVVVHDYDSWTRLRS